ncbi:uncharacterized protein LOC106662585 [Cimex lectularius]|uniref:Uncharacterized protein n=1 Tax=Cimex lectularius TaxID=79782 RepID=A0A8I6TDV3_CIMLE|nr:uncharacterized protein LOC106662585 [Cimex lectularius]
MTVSFKNPREEEKISLINYTDPRIRVGNWLQRQYKFIRHNIKKESSYSIDYKPASIDYNCIEENAETVATKVNEAYGKPVADNLIDEEFECNFLTLYDINYNNIWRRFGNNKDYLANKINAVNYGLIKDKRQRWIDEHNEINNYLSVMKRDYVAHEPVPKYPVRREQAKEADKKSVCRMFIDSLNLKTREDKICFCPCHPEICAAKPRNPKEILP